MMHVIAMLFAAFLMMGNAFGQDASTSAPLDYRTVITACGAEWRASDTRKNTPKGQGTAAWNAFRKDCVAKSGYVPKRGRAASAATTQ